MRSNELREIRVVGDLAFVILTRGYMAVIDAVDAHLVRGSNWSAVTRGRTVYAVRRLPQNAQGKRREIGLHRQILDDPSDQFVDHRDNNGLNNRRENLRAATAKQNCHNQQLRVNNTSGFKGVSQSGSKWRVHLGVNGKKVHLGYFLTIEEAHHAYVTAAKELHGEFFQLA